jgi:hypothetical protein
MDAQQIRDSLTNEQIISILASLGSENYDVDSNNNLIFKTVCHCGESYKLYYYTESRTFHCYTSCSETFDIFELIARNKDYSFIESVNYICRMFNIQQYKKKGFKSKNLIDDWSIIEKYTKYKNDLMNVELKYFNKSTLNLFKNFYHLSWINDGISVDTMRKYDIKFDIIRNKIIIPHYDIAGNLIGIRGRAFNIEEIEAGKKYMPLYVENTEYNHPLGYNLYGIYENQEVIRRTKKVMILEGEKSVLLCEDMFPGNNFTVACCGSNITNYQRNLLLQQGIREVFIAFDKEYVKDATPESEKYAEKLLRIAYKFVNYVTTYIIWDNDNLLEFKDSPCDKGKEILLELMKNKYEIYSKIGD